MSQQTSFEARIALRPRSLDETFDLSLAYLRVFSRDLRRLLVVSVLATVTLPVLCWLLFGLVNAEAVALAVVTGGVAERSVTAFAGRHLFGNPASVKAAWGAVLRRPFFGLSAVLIPTLPALMVLGSDFDDAWLGFAIVLGFFWPFVLASHAHLSEVVYLEQLAVGRAGQRARALVAYRFGRALGLVLAGLLVRGLFVYGTYTTAAFLFGFVLQFKGVTQTMGPAFLVLGYALSGPFMALVRFFDYIDARTRREGWDIQVRFNAIAQQERVAKERSLAA